MESGLDSIRAGTRAVVMQIQANPVLTRRFCQIGIKPGTVVYCRYRSPSGRVVALEFRDTAIALHTKDLRRIRIACPGI